MANNKEFLDAATIIWEGAQQRLDFIEVRVTPESLAYLRRRIAAFVREEERISADTPDSLHIGGVRFTTLPEWTLASRIIPREPGRLVRWACALDAWWKNWRRGS